MQTWAQVLTRARGGCVVHRCQNKNSRTRGCEWRHAPEACAEDWGGLKIVESCGLKKKGDTCWGGADGKASIERLCFSPYVEKLLNSKVIKSFVPELRSRKCFSGFLCSMYMCYEHSMYVSPYSCMGMLQYHCLNLWKHLFLCKEEFVYVIRWTNTWNIRRIKKCTRVTRKYEISFYICKQNFFFKKSSPHVNLSRHFMTRGWESCSFGWRSRAINVVWDTLSTSIYFQVRLLLQNFTRWRLIFNMSTCLGLF